MMPPVYRKVMVVALLLSCFMTCVTFLVLPAPSQSIDSREKVLVVEQGMLELMDAVDAPPSVRIMTNFSQPTGLPVLDAWTSLPWFRQLHTHRLVTMTWLILAPLQLASLGGQQLYSRAWHRRMGYVFVGSSSCIAMGLMEIIGKGRVYGEPRWLAMLINITKVIYFVASLVLAVGWYNNLKEHKKWILRHVTMGYTVAFQRVLMFVAGPALHATIRMISLPEIDTNRMLTSEEMQQWYNITSIVAVVVPFALLERYVLQGPFLDSLGSNKSPSQHKRD